MQTIFSLEGNCRRNAIALLLVLLAVTTALLIHSVRTLRQESQEIRSRYEAFRLALQAKDTNAARLFFPVERRGGAHRAFGVLSTFVIPLGSKTTISIAGNRATVVPERLFHYGVIPGGHRIELIKNGEEWCFTGGVHVD